jgi:hypothetical protein
VAPQTRGTASPRRRAPRASPNHLRRNGALRAFADTFSRETLALARVIAPELAELPPDRAVESLQARLAQAQQDAARRQQLEERIERERKTVSKAKRELETARLELEALLSQARCATREALLEAETRSQQARQLDAEIEIENRALAGHAGSQPIDLFAAEVASLDRDSLEREIAQLSQSLAGSRPRTRRKTAAPRRSRSPGESDGWRPRRRNRLPRRRRPFSPKRATPRNTTSAFISPARFSAARSSATAAKTRTRSSIAPAPCSPRSPSSSFSGIVTDFREEDDPVLLGIRPSGEEVEVSGMSEGARDQLYLALRVATLERQMQLSEPLPFVVDDVLVSFDDARARAALSVLAELCARTQVLFFTHHPHLVELARQAVPDSLRREHHLRI